MSDYPTDEDLKFIKDFDIVKTHPNKMVDHLEAIWWTPSWGFKKVEMPDKSIELELHTGGWSGNEEIIGTLMDTMFWDVYWEKSLKGGHYYFKVYKLKKEKKCLNTNSK